MTNIENIVNWTNFYMGWSNPPEHDLKGSEMWSKKKTTHDDHILFMKRNDKKVTILQAYVDDIIVTSDDSE